MSVALEKVQVAALAQRLGELLEELERRGIEDAAEIEGEVGDTAALDEPLNEAFRVGTLSLGWDTGDELVILEARELDRGGGRRGGRERRTTTRTRTAPTSSGCASRRPRRRRFVARAVRVLAAGRPPCPLCGQPLDPQGHLCPRRNGHLLN